ncbi:MAG: hydrogenase iron-sulfur subunit [Candidatus Helarchaeota archaeon]|nr:hydrogenase iron-sulfur subunit [Candidatus Helarchaeota archaeon]
MENEDFDPRIVAFCCNWCGYAGADLAGTRRLQYPPNIHIIRVMCSGRIDPELILNALRLGADGVLIAGCHLGDCQYVSGNEKTLRRIEILKKLLAQFGFNKERVRLEWISASESTKFVEVVKDMVAKIKKLGKNPLRKNLPLNKNLKSIK